MTVTILVGDVREHLRGLPAEISIFAGDAA